MGVVILMLGTREEERFEDFEPRKHLAKGFGTPT